MNKTEITKLIDEITKTNKEYTANTNALLNKLRVGLPFSGDAYKQGTEDAWELARKICGLETDGALSFQELDEIFGTRSYSKIFRDNTYEEALAKIKEYEEKKNKLVPGDVVKCSNRYGTLKGILYSESSTDYWILLNSCTAPQNLTKDAWTIEKTGKHFDIQGMLDMLDEEQEYENRVYVHRTAESGIG